MCAGLCVIWTSRPGSSKLIKTLMSYGRDVMFILSIVFDRKRRKGWDLNKRKKREKRLVTCPLIFLSRLMIHQVHPSVCPSVRSMALLHLGKLCSVLTYIYCVVVLTCWDYHSEIVCVGVYLCHTARCQLHGRSKRPVDWYVWCEIGTQHNFLTFIYYSSRHWC